MDNVLIIGIDTVAGRAVGQHLAGRTTVHGLWTKSPECPAGVTAGHISATQLDQQIADADLIVFCGGASTSSWDSDFGRFSVEKKWLAQTVAATNQTEARLAYISSDAVFGGPWVFHDDDSQSYADNSSANAIREFEQLAEDSESSLIVRTNVLGASVSGSEFVTRVLTVLQNGESEHIDSVVHASPIAADEFAEVLAECLAAGTTGYLNVGGAERTTPFRFALTLAASVECDVQHLMPGPQQSCPQELSLRCTRLRQELRIHTSVLKETAQRVAQDARQFERQSVAA